jgi:hypothetical protein
MVAEELFVKAIFGWENRHPTNHLLLKMSHSRGEDS